MDGKPTYHFILLTFISLVYIINSQTGEGCPRNTPPCPAGQVRMNAIYNPSGVFIGGCNCFVIFCAFPRIYDTNSQTCQCSNRPTYGCPAHQFFNEDTCQCECIELQIPGSDLLTCIENTQPEPIVRPDCSCECLLMGCPMHKYLNEKRCECECPPCPMSNERIVNENTCQCGSRYPQIIPPPTPPPVNVPPPTPPPSTTTRPPQIIPPPNNGPQVIPQTTKVITPPVNNGNGHGTNPHATTPPAAGATMPQIPHCCQPKMTKFAPYFGQCWGHIDPVECFDVIGNENTGFDPRGLCVWDNKNCLTENPTCGMTGGLCTMHTECCSHICQSDETCL